MLELHPGRKAFFHCRRVLEQRPKKDDHELSFATQCLAAFREELILTQRAEQVRACDKERLSRLNAIISVVMAMHFPLGNPPWGEFEKAMAWLGALVDEIEGTAPEGLAAVAR